MRSIEVHLIETGEDIDLAIASGLLEVDELDGAVCSACSDDIAYVNGHFYSFVIAIDSLDEPWIVCAGCASPIIDQDDTESFEDLFIAEEEFDEFQLREDD